MDFLDFRILDVIDIVLVALLLYYIYKLVRGTVAINIFIGIVIIYLAWKLTQLANMQMLSSVIGKFIDVGMIVLIVVFQQEIRKFLLLIGSTNWGHRYRFLRQLKFGKEPLEPKHNIPAIVQACYTLKEQKTGALIVIKRNTPLEFVTNTGDTMRIEVNAPILESIFYKNSTLHDGAIVIEDNFIVATRVILPVSDSRAIPLRFGLRHRAAVGISEKTDAIALVVSEETGNISYIKDGNFVPYTTKEELISILQKDTL